MIHLHEANRFLYSTVTKLFVIEYILAEKYYFFQPAEGRKKNGDKKSIKKCINVRKQGLNALKETRKMPQENSLSSLSPGSISGLLNTKNCTLVEDSGYRSVDIPWAT